MKTPMQEMLEYVQEEVQLFGSARQSLISKIKQLLEKEEEVIIETSKNSYIAGYLDNQAKVDDSMNFPEEYYNEAFKTKEK